MKLELMILGGDGIAGMEAALTAAGLPIAGIAGDQIVLFRARGEDGETIAYAALEGLGSDRLLRSVVVRPMDRRAGCGAAVLRLLEQTATELGVERLHLLTTTAASFFERAGYVVSDRHSAPVAIVSSQEFCGLCPASAAYMTKELRAD